MVVTNRQDWADRVRELRNWGDGEPSQTSAWGSNYRMDAFQGAVLSIKLRCLDEWNSARRGLAERYCRSIAGPALQAPETQSWATHIFHIFAVRARQRDCVRAAFLERGIETRVHYPIPLHRMQPFAGLGYAEGDFPEAERAAREVLSIPIHPELDAREIGDVCEALRAISMQTESSRVQDA
jgi:dTDP-4-amino-4,6-dideoxygalactose transaminase